MMCFSGLITIYLLIDFFEKVRRFLRHDPYWLDILTDRPGQIWSRMNVRLDHNPGGQRHAQEAVYP